MSATRVPIDGLWRCLCPSIDSIALSQNSSKLFSPRKRPTRPPARDAQSVRVQQFSTSIRAAPDASTRIPQASAAFKKRPKTPWKALPIATPSVVPETATSNATLADALDEHPAPTAKDGVSPGKSTPLPSSRPPRIKVSYIAPGTEPGGSFITQQQAQSRRVMRTDYSYKDAPTPKLSAKERLSLDSEETEALNERLRVIREREDSFHRVVNLVYYLIAVRGEEPSLLHYHSLLLANADAENGSTGSIRQLLAEMKAAGIAPDSGVYHAVLRALAIHPDYVLRAQIMKEMKERWYGLSPEGWHSLTVGLLRDRQIEMALDKLEQMITDGLRIQPWLYDIFLQQFCEADELDEAWKLLQYRTETANDEVTPGMWYYLLDKFASGFHYDATKHIWDECVDSSIINPSDGICVAVLNVAARASDAALATSVAQILSPRGTALAPFHYEALISAYLGCDDLTTAFKILSIMAKADHKPTVSSTRALYTYLSNSNERPIKAWDILTDQRKSGQVPPIAAANVVMEASMTVGKFDEGFDMYKNIHEIIDGRPNIETFNIIFQALSWNKMKRDPVANKELAMFLVRELHALDIKADFLTYDRLILICSLPGDYEDAFSYLHEMEAVGKEGVGDLGQRGWWMRKSTASKLVRLCVEAGDDRAWALLDRMKQRGMHSDGLLKWVANHSKRNPSRVGDSSGVRSIYV